MRQARTRSETLETGFSRPSWLQFGALRVHAHFAKAMCAILNFAKMSTKHFFLQGRYLYKVKEEGNPKRPFARRNFPYKCNIKIWLMKINTILGASFYVCRLSPAKEVENEKHVNPAEPVRLLDEKRRGVPLYTKPRDHFLLEANSSHTNSLNVMIGRSVSSFVSSSCIRRLWCRRGMYTFWTRRPRGLVSDAVARHKILPVEWTRFVWPQMNYIGNE